MSSINSTLQASFSLTTFSGASDNYDFFRDRILPNLNPNTVSALRSDWNAWQRFISSDVGMSRFSQLSAAEQVNVLIDYFDWLKKSYKPSTIRRRLAGLSMILNILGLPDGTKEWKFKQFKGPAFARIAAPETQAKPFRYPKVEEALRCIDSDMFTFRAALIVQLAYDTLCRASELIAVTMDDIFVDQDGSALLFVRRSKNDPHAAGSYRQISAETMKFVEIWMLRNRAAGRTKYLLSHITGRQQGNKIRRVKSGKDENPISYKAILAAFKHFGEEFSAHSARVGAVQDLTEHAKSLAEIQQAGGWKSPIMAAHYGRNINAKQGAMAQFRAKMRRSKPSE